MQCRRKGVNGCIAAIGNETGNEALTLVDIGKKEGVRMKRTLLFIDQTLGYALRNKRLEIAEFIDMKQKIAAMSRMIFDIPIDLFQSQPGLSKIGLQDVRVSMRASIAQIKNVHDLGCRQIKFYFDPAQEMSLLEKALNEAGRYRMDVTLAYLNISGYSLNTITLFQKLGREYSLKRVIVEDVNSGLDSLSTYGSLGYLKQHLRDELEYHGHNGRGLATGNALGAIKSGIRSIAVSIGGSGGYPAFEEVLMSAKFLLQKPLPIPQNLASNCKEILDWMGEYVPVTKPIIGSNIFAHESGIHVDGIIKKSELYEPFAPERVGLSRRIIIGKHSGKAAIEEKLRELNVRIHPSCVPPLLEKVRELTIEQKGPVSDTQLSKLVREVIP
jgi:homocitrate synthase NifV